MPITSLDKNFALVLLDFQMGMIDSSDDEAKNAVENAALLVAACREYEHPIVFIKFNPFKGTLVRARCDEPMFPPGTDLKEMEEKMKNDGWFDFVPKLEPEKFDTQIVKPNWNAFIGTDLEQVLAKGGITQIILCGVATSLDIVTTAITGLELGYNLVFPMDALVDPNKKGAENVKVRTLPRVGQTEKTNIIVGLIR